MEEEALLTAAASAARYVSWEEVVVSNDKGRRVVHYYLNRADGESDLAVVGREKSVRHMSYSAANQFLRAVAQFESSVLAAGKLSSSTLAGGALAAGLALKWKSRREVIDWLLSVLSDPVTHGSSQVADRFDDLEDTEPGDRPDSKALSTGKWGFPPKDFKWIGSASICKKRRKHYTSFYRLGVTISVHDFVFVMSEDNTRLVAFVEDLYEDMKFNKMVVVRWFHKVDEVAIILPSDVYDREIFFSLCLQDVSVECIDGLAAILSLQHFEQFQNETRHSKWKPYLCRRQIDNDDVKPFDITQVRGYWSQYLLRSMLTSPLKLRLKLTPGTSCSSREKTGDIFASEPQKPQLVGGDTNLSDCPRDKKQDRCLIACCKAGECAATATPGSTYLRKKIFNKKLQRRLSPGSHVEVLSQDSGIRGCWFRCVILKRNQDKVKIQYQDLLDPDEPRNIEEWVLLSRVAAPDELCIRISGRTVVRPLPSQRTKMSNFDVGAIVDAWWHDGWWEGIVVGIESEGKLLVYFPGEKRSSVFYQSDLRQSQDWVNKKWYILEDRKEAASLFLLDMKIDNKYSTGGQMLAESHTGNGHFREPNGCCMSQEKYQLNKASGGSLSSDKEGCVPDLTKDLGLKWPTKKRNRRGDPAAGIGHINNKRQCGVSSSHLESSNAHGGFLLPKSLAVEHDNCKIGGDHLFSAPMTLSSLVMSQ